MDDREELPKIPGKASPSNHMNLEQRINAHRIELDKLIINFNRLNEVVDEMKKDFNDVLDKFDKYLETTQRIDSATSELLQLFNTGKTVLNLFSLTGTFIRFVGGLAFAISCIWGLWYVIQHNLIPQAFSVIDPSKNPPVVK
jgi:hypothetical protein